MWVWKLCSQFDLPYFAEKKNKYKTGGNLILTVSKLSHMFKNSETVKIYCIFITFYSILHSLKSDE